MTCQTLVSLKTDCAKCILAPTIVELNLITLLLYIIVLYSKNLNYLLLGVGLWYTRGSCHTPTAVLQKNVVRIVHDWLVDRVLKQLQE